MSRVSVHVSLRGNAFMGDIAAALVEAARSLGHDCPPVQHVLPRADGGVHLVVAPHEFYRLSDEPVGELRRALAASVLVNTEQPGTPWFSYTVALCRGALAVYDINEVAASALRGLGVDAGYLRLGGVASMDHRQRVAGKDIDVAFLGALDDRRAGILAGLAPVLDGRRSELRLFPGDRPVHRDDAGLRFGADKYQLLGRSRVLVNLHRAGHDESTPYFEWARLVEAMANGCVVVTEPSSGHDPLVEGTHFVVATPDEFAGTVEALLGDGPRLAAIADAAADAVLGPLSLERSLAPVLDRLTAAPPVAPRHRVGRDAFQSVRAVAPRPVFRPHLELQRTAKHLVRRHDRLLRELDRASVELHGGGADDVTVVRSAAWEGGAGADVAVVVTLYNYAHLVGETIASVVASADVELELVVVDDASTDGGSDVVVAQLAHHPDLAWMVVSKACNQGLSAARNSGFAAARADAVMVLDADNLVRPHGIAKLLATLRATPGAAGAYGILDDFGEQVGLRSAFDWDVARLCRANYIDAQALLRRTTWESLGGYHDDDDEVYGWEDWDLWLRVAASGRSMAFCPEIVGSYRTQARSMVTLSNVAADDMRAAMRRRHPQLPWPTEDR